MILFHEAVTLTVEQYMLDLKKFLRDFEHFDPAIWSFQRLDFQAKVWKKTHSAQFVKMFLFRFVSSKNLLQKPVRSARSRSLKLSLFWIHLNYYICKPNKIWKPKIRSDRWSDLFFDLRLINSDFSYTKSVDIFRLQIYKKLLTKLFSIFIIPCYLQCIDRKVE